MGEVLVQRKSYTKASFLKDSPTPKTLENTMTITTLSIGLLPAQTSVKTHYKFKAAEGIISPSRITSLLSSF